MTDERLEMPLSRGEGPIRVEGTSSSTPSDGSEVQGSRIDDAAVHAALEGAREGARGVAPPVVIAIAGSIEDRLRIAEKVGTTAGVVMVASRAEAMNILAGTPGVHLQPERPVIAVADEQSGLEVDSDWRVAKVGDREVGLSPLEHDLLVCLLDEVGHIHTFESIQRSVWGNDHLGGRSHVQSVVKRLRRKLGDLDSPVQIDAVRGVGLRLVDVGSRRAPEGVSVPVPVPRKLPLSPTDPRLVPRPVPR